MKTSEVLKEGLRSYYHRSFMCNIVGDMATGRIGAHVPLDLTVQVERSIHLRLDGCFTLDAYLKKTNTTYCAIREATDNWIDVRLYNIRVTFWKGFIAELEAKGE